MTGYVFTVAGGKGGVGKTTTAINLGVGLHEIGYDVVVVDADLGMANLGAMLGIDHEPGLHQVLAGNASISDAIIEGPGGPSLVPGERTLEAFADANPANLRKVADSLTSAFDIVIIDTGAGLSHETTVPLGLSDGVIMVTTDDEIAIGDTIKTAQLAERVDGAVVGAVLSRATDETNVSRVADELDMEMLAVVPEDEQATREEPMLVHAPGSYAAQAYHRLASTVEDIYQAQAENPVTPTPPTDEGAKTAEPPEAAAGAEGAAAGSDADDEAASGASADAGGGGEAEPEPEPEPEPETEEAAEEGEEDESDDGVFGLFN